MSKEVSINIELFRANIKNLEDSLTRLESGMKKNSVFDYTNITPFINDLKHLVQADKLLEQYKTLLETDEAISQGQQKVETETLSNCCNQQSELKICRPEKTGLVRHRKRGD